MEKRCGGKGTTESPAWGLGSLQSQRWEVARLVAMQVGELVGVWIYFKSRDSMLRSWIDCGVCQKEEPMVPASMLPWDFKNGSAISKMDCKRSRLSGRERGRRESWRRGSDWEFMFGPVQRKMLTGFRRTDVKETIGSLSVEDNGEVCCGDTMLGLSVF